MTLKVVSYTTGFEHNDMAFHRRVVFVLFCGILLDSSNCDDCPNTWVIYDRHCYYFGHQTLPVFEAEHYCLQHAGHLVTIDDSSENAFLRDFLSYMKVQDWWIGLTDDETEGIWRWYGTGQKAEYFDWYPNEPNNNGNEDCVVLASGHWNDISCTTHFFFICERPFGDVGIVG